MSKSVLVVDDDVDLATTLAESLRDLGYEASACFSGSDVMTRLKAGARPGLILLDLMMPAMNGWRVCEELSASPELDPIPVLIMTAASNLKQPMPPHARGVIGKPFDLEDIVGRIEACPSS